MSENENVLTARYSVCQGSYWMTVCGISGFASVFLLARGFTSGQIGLLLAWANIIAAILQPTMAGKADRGGKLGLKELTLLLGAVGLLAVIGLYLVPGSIPVIAVLYILTLLSIMALQPLINAIGVYYMNRGISINYGVARAVGSLTYAILSYLLGTLVEKYSENVITLAGILTYLVLLLAVGTFQIKQGTREKERKEKKEGLLNFFGRHKRFTVMLVGIVCLYLYHYIVSTYMIQIMTAVGGNSKDMGTAVAMAAVLELPVMIFFSKIVGRFGAGNLMKLAGVFFFVKAVLTYLAGSVAGVFVAQAFQLLSFAVYTPASVYYANQVMEEQDKVKGQALMTAATTTGGVLGNFLGGRLIDAWGVSAMLLLGTVSAGIGMILLFLTIPGEKKGY